MCIFSKSCRYKGYPVIWTDKISVTQRFKLVLDGEAVLDNETGLVWEKAPSSEERNLNSSIVYARRKAIGGRMG